MSVNIQRGDIVIVPFPFTDLSTTKKRPAVVISNARINNNSQDMIILPISSNLTTSTLRDAVIITNSNLSSGNLPMKSAILTQKVLTLNKSLIDRKTGSINTSTLTNAVNNLIRNLT